MPRYPTPRAAGTLPACCTPCSFLLPADPKTTTAAAHTTTAPAPVAPPASAPPSPPPLLATARSTPLHSDTQTTSGSPTPHPALHVSAILTASPVASARPSRKSCHPALPALPPVPPQTNCTKSLPAASVAPDTSPPIRTPAPAMPSGPASRSASTEMPPAPSPRSAPCTPVNSRPLPAAARPHLTSPLPPLPHIPPAASLLPPPPAPPPPHPAPHLPSAAPLRSPPTQSGILVSSPADPHDPKTPGSRPSANAPDPRSGTSASPLPHTGPPQIVPPLIPRASNTPAPAPLPLRITPRSLPPAPAPGSRPIRTLCN